jgi:hypothetical protein
MKMLEIQGENASSFSELNQKEECYEKKSENSIVLML